MTQKIHIARPHGNMPIKLVVDAHSATATRLPDLLIAHKCVKAVKRRLKSTYYDTATHDLRANRISLRVRKVGKSWRQRIKIAAAGKSGRIVEDRLATATPDVDAISDAHVRKQVRKVIAGAPLEAAFITDVRRTTHVLSDSKGSRVKVALDDAVVKTASNSHTFTDLKLVLKDGQIGALVDVATALIAKTTPLAPQHTSNEELGYHLLLNQPNANLKPAKMVPGRIAKTDTSIDGLRILATAMTQQILHNWSVVLRGTDPEGAHQLRVGLRQLRTMLRAFRPVIDSAEMRALEQDLKRLGRVVGTLRDLDVLGSDIVAPVAVPSQLQGGHDRVARAVAARRDGQRETVRQTLAAPHLQALQVRLALLPQQLGAAQNQPNDGPSPKHIKSLARRALNKSWRGAMDLGKRIDALTIPERHELRKRLKGLRYTLDAFGPLYPKRTTQRFIRDLKQLQEVFGYLNDATLAEQLFDLKPADVDDAAFHQAIGHITGYHAAQSTTTWYQAKQFWRDLVAAKRPWG